MASPVNVAQVGSYFIQQYHQMFHQQRDTVHQFYTDDSSMSRIDGDSSESFSGRVQIHQVIMSLSFTSVEIKTINSLESLNGGVLVVVSGSVKSRDFDGWRKFVQTFFLAPQESSYFVLNDIFHFADEKVPLQPPPTSVEEQKNDYQPNISAHLPETPVSDDALEEEAREYMYSVHIEGDEPVEGYSFQKHDSEAETVDKEPAFEESSVLIQDSGTTVQEAMPAAEKPVGELPKLTYASILLAPKGKLAPSVSFQPSFTYSNQPASNWYQASPVQQSNPVVSGVPDSGLNLVDNGLSQEEGDSRSVYVKNLPSSVTRLDILQEFKNFGKIKHDGVFLKNRQDTGVCYAFVEFEDVQSARNAIKASPVQLSGRPVYIEERRPNNSSASRGGRSGRGRGKGGRFGTRTFAGTT
ncbi:putative G3BP-like protein isoform X2 [Olea europaea var. sylvestris]|uniref:G3BP isoform X1 n=1 Tax=Olea europaea subsp. europaea TaxID=158383 RepID=A0A8S0P8X7_OLEEU|nr:putative G3BP-like protein isoform X2 [Olea europaea var. sylvestris]CAA2934064.1 G3BP isoform X1 [Olea europaea subsp. europaea]